MNHLALTLLIEFVSSRFSPAFFLAFALALILILLLIRQLRNLKNYLKPSSQQIRSKTWLQVMYSTIATDGGEDTMRLFARKYFLKKRSCSSVIRDVQWRVYLNLQYIRRELSRTPARTIAMIPASLWLFDNYNLIYREIKKLQGTGNLRALSRLPALDIGVRKGYPRIYLIAQKIISRSNNHLRENTIIDNIEEFQQVVQLKSAELWALPHVLSLCLLERIVDEAIRMIQSVHVRVQADETADRIAASLRGGDLDPSEVLRKENFWQKSQNNVFLAHFFYRLRSLSVDEADIVLWLAKINGLSLEEYQTVLAGLIQQDRRHEALAESVISALITSLKEIGEMNWEEHFQSVSRLEAELKKDPAGIYSRMDDNTRGRYRLQVEKLAKKFKMQESDVAAKAIKLAETAAAKSVADPLPGLAVPVHVGTYLVGDGRYLLTDQLSNRPARSLKPVPVRKKLRGAAYLAVIFGMTTLMLLLVNLVAGPLLGAPSVWLVLLYIQLGLLALGVAVQLTQTFFTYLIQPQAQLAMNFLQEIPDEFRTYVVMPVILNNPAAARDYAARLEKYYLANKQANLYFALLGDLKDAPDQFAHDDDEILQAATGAIQALNDEYPGSYVRFSLLLRSRQWNESQGCWMCWERKRGKLEELNALLAGEEDVGFEVRLGSQELFPTLRYVITLDADTELIRESAVMLIGIMAHPLNQPVIDEETHRVVSGYAIVQSEISSRISDAKASFFTRIFAGESGIDSYASVISDIYQDTFDEGSFVGKGIYDFRVLHRLLRGVIPENTVLSHDLLESSLTRCAFASGIRLLDSTPPSVAAFASRDHRWIRGDWQLLPWLIRRSPINWLSRWKMFDNLRRSLLPVASVLAILINAAFFPQLPWIWLPFVLFNDAWSLLNQLLGMLFQKLRNPSVRIAFQILLENMATLLIQSLLYIVLLPFRACLSLDAVTRTLYRMLISHSKLLEWQTAEAVEQSMANSLSSYVRLMWPAFIPAIALGVAAVLFNQMLSLAFLLLLAIIWLASPWIAWLVSQPSRQSTQKKISPEDAHQLRLLARKTWRFFEDFSTEENNGLCPDNLQQFPGPRLSDKTSPTNIGMQLLSALSACDFGFITLHELIDHCDAAMKTLQRLPKWHGHLYNWYNVKTLEILMPHYVSTVDSGNFLGHILTVKNGLRELEKKLFFSDQLHLGLRDTLEVAGLDPRVLAGAFDTKEQRDILLTSLYHAAETPDLEAYWQNRLKKTADHLGADLNDLPWPDSQVSCPSLDELADSGLPAALVLKERIRNLGMEIDWLVRTADFRMLYDEKDRLFHIGYNVSNQVAENGHYDLLASEARLTSFLAIAKGDVPQKHWFALGRPLTLVRGIPALVSWSGTMFEYLMPNLVLKTPRGTLLDRSCYAAVDRQIVHGRKHGIPWGVSESQYFMFDMDSNYQYAPFGMQYLRLQSSMSPAKVVAPYATILALDVKPAAALKNLHKLLQIGAGGPYGLYEALDFNRPNAATLNDYSLVQSFMAHHQGMIMASINNSLHQKILQRRFHREPMVRATSTLLEERRSLVLVLLARYGYSINIDQEDYVEEKAESRYCNTINPPTPVAHVLSNNHYLLMLASDGQGFSSCDTVMLYRWRPERVGESHGNFVYIRNIESGQIWSNTYHPTLVQPDEYQAIFSADKVEYKRKDGLITTHTDITLSPIENFEIRRVTFTNHGDKPVEIEATSYLEVVDDLHLAEAMHPAFNKLFLEMEYVQDSHLLLAGRRKRESSENPGLVLHMVRSEARFIRAVEYETDRRAFIGRGETKALPQALRTRLPLAGRSGFSNDPIMSLRATVRIPVGRSVSVSFFTGYAPNRDAAIRISQTLGKSVYDNDIFRQALASSKLERKYLNIDLPKHNAIQSLIGPLYYPTRSFRDEAEKIRHNVLGQSSLWRFGISGDDPIILLRIQEMAELPVLKDVLLAYEFMHDQTIQVDLVIVNEEADDYALPLQQRIMELTSVMKIYKMAQQKSGLFLLRRGQMSEEESILLSTVARIVIWPKTGIYRSHKQTQTAEISNLGNRIIPLTDGLSSQTIKVNDPFMASSQTLEFFNGIGGFTQDGREYEIWPAEGRSTPAPWINVIANACFGFQVSETGAGYTWAGNSRENKLTTWSNDPVLDPASEVIYIKDQVTGAITSPAALQSGRGQDYQVRHGFGYSVFNHTEIDLEQSMTLLVTTDSPVKLYLVRIRDLSGRPRQLSLTFYAEWILGALREQTAPYIVTRYDEQAGLFLAKNVFAPVDHQPIAFLFASEPIVSYTGDQSRFLGLDSSINYPNGLAAEHLSGVTGAGLDPCGAIQVEVSLAANESRAFVFGLGQAANVTEAGRLADLYRSEQDAEDELEGVHLYWQNVLGKIQVKSPDRAMDLLINGWLLYQTISCRLLARSAFYQSGGAYGFRDQLQDVLAVMHTDPKLTARQIRLCSAHQFVEGDVQHWWHPDSGVGVRTLISDDLLWLPYVTAAYFEHTGNRSLLLEKVDYIEEDPLPPGLHERMSVPRHSDLSENIYLHGLRAIEQAGRVGAHGLPLMGGGDWNDGMNRVGIEGRGESVWLGWFYYAVLKRFAPLCLAMDDQENHDHLNSLADAMRVNLDENAWDGQWYLRAFFDDGSPLGSHANEECQIDSISQSWAVLSEAAGPERSRIALESASRYLVHRDAGLIQLLTPPFNQSKPDPGYIKGYFPGIRENGGQYTHAAVWLAMANAKAGNGLVAHELLTMLNPIHATATTRDMARYEREPYVMSADIYMGVPFTGKAGWSWYTGSAGWMYQALLQSLLGISRQSDRVTIEPALPAVYPGWQIDYQHGSSLYRISVENDSGCGVRIASLTVDGILQTGHQFTLSDDQQIHDVILILLPAE